jgi:hypothetical protein
MSEKSAQVLKEYLKKNRWSKRAFAEACGVCRFSIFKYLNGANMQHRIAEKIVAVSNKEIKLHQLIE